DVEGVVADRAEDEEHFALADHEVDAGVDRLAKPGLGGGRGVTDLAASSAVDLGQDAGQEDQPGDDHRGDRGGDQGGGERGAAGQDVDRLEHPEDDQGEAADRAGDEEEDGRAADREGGRDPRADQDHGTERQAAAAAGGEEDVGALLDHADVEG